MAGTIVADTLQDGAGNSTAMDNAIYGSAKAWVNFDPSSASSAVIRASYNVSSVSYVGTGQYTINFTNAFSDAKYSVFINNGSNAGTNAICAMIGTARTTYPTTGVAIGSCAINIYQTSGGATNPDYVTAGFFR